MLTSWQTDILVCEGKLHSKFTQNNFALHCNPLLLCFYKTELFKIHKINRILKRTIDYWVYWINPSKIYTSTNKSKHFQSYQFQYEKILLSFIHSKTLIFRENPSFDKFPTIKIIKQNNKFQIQSFFAAFFVAFYSENFFLVRKIF